MIGVGVVVVNEQLWQRLLWVVVIGLLIGTEYMSYKSTHS